MSLWQSSQDHCFHTKDVFIFIRKTWDIFVFYLFSFYKNKITGRTQYISGYISYNNIVQTDKHQSRYMKRRTSPDVSLEFIVNKGNFNIISYTPTNVGICVLEPLFFKRV